MSNRFGPENAYEELTGRKLNADQLARWGRLTRVLGIRTDDPVWSIVICMEFYADSYDRSTRIVACRLRECQALLLLLLLVGVCIILRLH